MTQQDLIDDLRSRINPAYAAQLGTESYERRVCAEAIEQLVQERDALKQDAELTASDRDRMFLDLTRTRQELSGALIELRELRETIKNALVFVEMAHYPPVADKFEFGRMVHIRLHALASLYDAAMKGKS